ncbi:MAG: Omp28-related outer membrane protein [Muribaculaceae bacterium]|nr:Omp28-related outer membrane protein [Muribaculaceae bacterium]
MKGLFADFSKKALAVTAFAAMAGSVAYADTMYVSYGVKTDDPVYRATGFATNEDVAGMNVAVCLTKDMLAPYEGASVVAVHIGWSGAYEGYKPEAEVFLRHSLDGEDLTTTKVELSNNVSGWNVARFDTPYVIGADEDLVMGYTVDMAKGKYGPCTLVWGSFPEGTHFVSRPDPDDPSAPLEWIDLITPGVMDMACPLMMVAEIEVSGEGFTNLVGLNKAAVPSMLAAGEPTGAFVSLSNNGSNAVQSITVTCSQDGAEPWSMNVALTNPISSMGSGVVSIPVYAASTGEVQLSISGVNGEPNNEDPEKTAWTFRPIVVPADVAAQYTRRPLMEYVASESEYRAAAYYDDIVDPALKDYDGRITRVIWHINDQFQLGLADDRDEAWDFISEIGNIGNGPLSMPNIMVDRDMNLVEGNYALSTLVSPLIGVLYSPYAEYSYEYALAQPTFAALNVESACEDKKVKVNVSGQADLSVLPEGEQLMLTVLLLEDGVESDSQEFPGGTGEGSNAGHYVHNRMVRHLLTSIWGDPVNFTDGKFDASFETELDYDNVPENMVAVAFLNRAKDNGIWEHNVINSAEASMQVSGVGQVAADADALRPVLEGNSLRCPQGCTMSVCSTDGIPADPSALRAGLYIVSVRNADGASASFKYVVK